MGQRRAGCGTDGIPHLISQCPRKTVDQPGVFPRGTLRPGHLYFEGDGFYFNRGLDDSLDVDGSSDGWIKGFSLGGASVEGAVGRYWLYVYLEDQKVVEVSYEIVR